MQKHICFVRFSSMGDIVLQTAILVAFRKRYPDYKITFFTRSEFEELIPRSLVNSVVSFDKNKNDYLEVFKRFNRENKIDLIVDLHVNLRTFILKLTNFHIRNIAVGKRNFFRFLITKFNFLKFKLDKYIPLQVLRPIYDLDNALDLKFDLNDHKEFLKLKLNSNSELTYLDAIESKPFDNYIVLAPIASFDTKLWSIDSYKKLLDLILKETNYKVVIINGPSDENSFQLGQESEKVLNVKGKNSIQKNMSIIKGAKYCIGNDTGIIHIAEAFGITSLMIYGATSSSFGFRPHLKKSKYIESGIDCHPCSKTGSKPCYKQTIECLQSISVNQVYSTFKEMLNDSDI